LDFIEIEGRPAMALFDTGAVYTYVRAPYLDGVPRRATSRPIRVALGGQLIEIRELCLIQGKIEGLEFDTDAVPVEKLAIAEGFELDAIIGVLTMERYDIRLDPRSGTLDLEGLRRREFTEF
jgi:hypothetical protein